MQRQALQDFAPRMTQFEEQQRQQYAAARTALSAVRTAHQEVESGNADIAELEADKRSLQQSAEEMQQQLASNSQVTLLDPCVLMQFHGSLFCMLDVWMRQCNGWPGTHCAKQSVGAWVHQPTIYSISIHACMHNTMRSMSTASRTADTVWG